MRTFLLFLLMLVCFDLSAQQRNETITVDGIKRDFITYIPAGTGNADKLPVIISLHGRLGTAERQMKFANFKPVADRDKVIIVCPQGIDRSWNDGRGTPAHDKGVNDVKFIDQLITFMLKHHPADASRIYVTGMSNGGFMASRLACELHDRIAAIAVVAASMDNSESYRPVKPIPVMYIQGTNDPLVPFAGGKMKRGAGGTIYGHEEVLNRWVIADGCNGGPQKADLPIKEDDGTNVIKEVYENPSTHINVVGYTITGGGHTWPGGSQYLPKMIVGSVSHNLDACQAIWDFFKGNRLASN